MNFAEMNKLMFDAADNMAEFDDAPKSDPREATKPYNRGSIARDEEMCALLRRQVELLELLCKNQAIALAKLTGGKAAPAGPSMDSPLNPPRQRPSNE